MNEPKGDTMDKQTVVMLGQTRRWTVNAATTQPFKVVEKDGEFGAEYRPGDVYKCSLNEIMRDSVEIVAETPKKLEVYDWAQWAPPASFPPGPFKAFHPGQVWASRLDTGPWLVWRCHASTPADSRSYANVEVLASGGGDKGPHSGERQLGTSSIYACHAVIVQDVGQPKPTPPEKLYGNAPRPLEASPVDWAKWLPEKPVKQHEAVLFKKGEIWASRWEGNRAVVFRVLRGNERFEESALTEVLALDGLWATVSVGSKAKFTGSSTGRHAVLLQGPGQTEPPGPKNMRCVAIPVVADRRQVSHSGAPGTWVDYERLDDGDAFDTYKHRRLVRGKEVVVEYGQEKPPLKLRPAATSACAWRDQAFPGGMGYVSCLNVAARGVTFCEKHIAQDMKRIDAAKAAERERNPVVRRSPEAQSHTGGFVGVWSTRAPK